MSNIKKSPDGGKDKSRLDPIQDGIICAVVSDFQADSKFRSATVIKEVLKRCNEQEIDPPSPSTIKRRVANFKSKSQSQTQFFNIDPFSPEFGNNLKSAAFFRLNVKFMESCNSLQGQYANIQTLESVMGILLGLKHEHNILNDFGDMPTPQDLQKIIERHHSDFFGGLRKIGLPTFTIKEAFVVLFLFHWASVIQLLNCKNDNYTKLAVKHTDLASEAYAEARGITWNDNTINTCCDSYYKDYPGRKPWKPMTNQEWLSWIKSYHAQERRELQNQLILQGDQSISQSKKWESITSELLDESNKNYEDRSLGGKGHEKTNSKNFALEDYKKNVCMPKYRTKKGAAKEIYEKICEHIKQGNDLKLEGFISDDAGKLTISRWISKF